MCNSSTSRLWILDAGHGIETEGKRSPSIPPGILEYEFNRDVVSRIAKALYVLDIPFHIVCQDEHTMDLDERVAIEKTMAEAWDMNAAFISVHSNASGKGGWDSARGFRVFSFGAHAEKERFMSEIIVRHVKSNVIGWAKNSKIKTAGFTVIKPANIPCILTENGFMTNREDCEILSSNGGRNLIANYHVGMILDCEDEWR